MVAYADMPPYGRSRAAARVSGREEAESLIRSELERGHGLILLGAHLGQWDAALIDLAKSGRKVHVIMRREEESAARFAETARRVAGLRIVHASEDAFMMVDLLAALRRGEIVAAQGDRAYGNRLERVTLFGGETRIPSGPLELARLSGASILPAAWVFERGGGYRVVMEAPLRPAAAAGVAAAACAAAMERLIGAHPEQWFNFYDLWEERRETAAPPGSAGKAA
jgi:KDO2-lipid IV(A) lauroyltransferase